jgi:hypothetical protein
MELAREKRKSSHVSSLHPMKPWRAIATKERRARKNDVTNWKTRRRRMRAGGEARERWPMRSSHWKRLSCTS